MFFYKVKRWFRSKIEKRNDPNYQYPDPEGDKRKEEFDKEIKEIISNKFRNSLDNRLKNIHENVDANNTLQRNSYDNSHPFYRNNQIAITNDTTNNERKKPIREKKPQRERNQEAMLRF